MNEPLFNYLKLKVNEKGSILDLVYLIKDGYGTYTETFSPLINLNIVSGKEEFKIEKVIVSIKNYQSPEELISKWNINYNNNSAKGDFFRKELIENNFKYKVYNISSGNERVDISKKIYYNKKTKLDSIVGSWNLYSNNIEHNFREFYTNMKSKKNR